MELGRSVLYVSFGRRHICARRAYPSPHALRHHTNSTTITNSTPAVLVIVYSFFFFQHPGRRSQYDGGVEYQHWQYIEDDLRQKQHGFRATAYT